MIRSRLYLLLALLLSLGTFSYSYAQPSEDNADLRQAYMLYQKAKGSFARKDFHDCIEQLRDALNYTNQNKDIYHLLAMAQAENGENADAITSFKNALNIDYNYIACRNDLGCFQMKLGNFDEAKATFKECILNNPKYPFPHYHLGQILQRKGDLDGAIEEYETATRLNPSYFEAQLDLGLAIYERASSGLTDIIDCEERLKTAASLAPQNPMIHYHLGNIYCADGKLDAAEQEFRTSLSLDNKLAAAHYELGRLRYFRGDPDRCLVELNIASKINPAYAEGKSYPGIDISPLKMMMAKCYEIKNNNSQAMSFWEDVASMTKNNKDILKHIKQLEKQKTSANRLREKGDCQGSAAQSLLVKGITQNDSGEIDAAKATFEIMARDYPNCFEAWQNQGALQETSGNLQSAMADYKRAIELAPEFDGLYYNLANLLEKMGLAADAGAMYAQFHEIAGKYPYDSKHIVGLEQENARQQAKFHK